ncbi:MAG: quinone-dependent dihydroorotate dehydrogenase [Acidiferrobacter sp.]
MYKTLRPWLFRIPAETAHHAALTTLQTLGAIPGAKWFLGGDRVPDLPVTVMGLRFANPLGLAAGFDKDGRALAGLAALGFGFLEAGTVTPRAQPGNPKPRLFRLPAHSALINRLGFNNEGVDALVKRLIAHRHALPIGVNIGKNRDTPLARAVDDYRLAFATVAPYADYITVNLSSPNTPGLRTLQEPEVALQLLGALKEDQQALWQSSGRRVPIAVKIAPDFTQEALDALISVLREVSCEAVIATNTTVSRPTSDQSCTVMEQGGLSGAPLGPLSLEVISRVFKGLPGIPIIGAGGIIDAQTAWSHLVAGASLLQIYTGFVYEGPGLLHTIMRDLTKRVQEAGHDDLVCALRAARRNLSSGTELKTIQFP